MTWEIRTGGWAQASATCFLFGPSLLQRPANIHIAESVVRFSQLPTTRFACRPVSRITHRSHCDHSPPGGSAIECLAAQAELPNISQ